MPDTFALVTAVARLHPGQAPAPHDLWSAWEPPLVMFGTLFVIGALYVRGVRGAWTRAGRGRSIGRARVAAFAGGMAALAVAVCSPLDVAASALFSAHMVQHLLLVLVCGPLLAAARVELALLWAIPARARVAFARRWARARRPRRIASALTAPLTVWMLHTLALWAWHAPRLYDAAARSEAVHLLEHASFLGTAVLFARVLPFGAARARLSHGAAILYLFAAAMQSGVLGALLSLAGTPWYGAHLATTGPWGLTPLEDQQIAGAIMWGPAGAAYLLAMLWMMREWLRSAGRDARGDRTLQTA